jgi:uncharacterized peroxidase-related enzyme
MQRIVALNLSNTPTASQAMLDAVQKKLGMVPNLFKTIAHSPAALQFYLQQGEALSAGSLPAPLREQIALVTAGTNGCDYCASAHTVMGKGVGLNADEITKNLSGRASDTKTQAALDFTKAIVQARGQVTDAQIEAVRSAGFGDADIVEMVAHVAANVFTNYFNLIARTVVDFPLVSTAPTRAAA